MAVVLSWGRFNKGGAMLKKVFRLSEKVSALIAAEEWREHDADKRMHVINCGHGRLIIFASVADEDFIEHRDLSDRVRNAVEFEALRRVWSQFAGFDYQFSPFDALRELV